MHIKELDHWVVWKYVEDKKIPYNAKTGTPASSTSSESWSSFEEAERALSNGNNSYDGLGYVFTSDDGLCGIDLDHCFDEDEALKSWAAKILNEIDSYTEVSPSKEGLHIITKAALPPGGNRKGPVEMYDQGRYFTYTGDIYKDKKTIEERQQQLERVHAAIFAHRSKTAATTGSKLEREEIEDLLKLALASENGKKFGRLWNGDTEGYASHSEADEALCSMLAFWTGGNLVAVDQMFRLSGLYRDKWEREGYRLATLEKCLKQTNGFHREPGDPLGESADDEGNAQCVRVKYKGKLLYCSAFGWMVYDGKCWKTEMADALVDRAIIQTLKGRRSAAIQTDGEFEAIVRAARPSASHVRNCKAILQALLAVPISAFDTSPDLLNCENGIINLKTGELIPHTLEQKFTYCLPIEYDPNADQSEWVNWLKEALGGSESTLEFVQKAVGYSLTGHTREEIMFYIWGPPRAGKGTFAETIIAMMGGSPLAMEVDISMFTESRRGGSQNFDLAGLKATRFVVASESKETHWLDGAKLKRWTGGNFVRCAHKYQGFFTYRPQFKIWLTSNFPLQIDPDDEAAWTRPQVLQFPNSWVGREDKTLKDRMRQPEVLRGVLAWAVEGAMKWYALSKGGLRAPIEVQSQTLQAREDLDWVAKWISEEIAVTKDENDFIPNDTLYHTYRNWCQERGAPVKKLPALNRTLAAKGFDVSVPKWHDGKTKRGWVGAKRIKGRNEQVLERLAKEIPDED